MQTTAEPEVIDLTDHDFDIPCGHEAIHTALRSTLPAAWIVWLDISAACPCAFSVWSGPVCEACLTFMQTTEHGAICNCPLKTVVAPFREAIARTERLRERPHG